MNTENKNELIAKFMGYEFVDGNFKVPHSNKTNNSNLSEWCPTYLDGDDVFGNGGYLLARSNLLFNSDWNWLMEVVEKIESLGIDVHINTCVCRIVDVGEDRFEDIECFVNDNKKQAVYNACIKFIQWYNENK
jgi:hypothetical protein